MRRTPTSLLAVAAAWALAVTTATPAAADTPTDTRALRQAVTVEGVKQHLSAFQAIAGENDGTRASGTPGYADSVAYVTDVLTDAGYSVREQEFEYELFSQDGPTVLDPTAPDLPAYNDGTDDLVMEYSGKGDVTAPLQAVDLVLPPGAAPSTSNSRLRGRGLRRLHRRQHRPDPARHLRLRRQGRERDRRRRHRRDHLQRGPGRAGPGDATAARSAPQVAVPVVGTTFALGNEPRRSSRAARRSDGQPDDEHASSVTRTTFNVIAETRDRPHRPGRHGRRPPRLASTEGPGINDNGIGNRDRCSRSPSRCPQSSTPSNQVRFAFWGAEESGLLGSEYYVEPAERPAEQGHRAEPELRHAGLAQLRPLRLRR